MSSPVALSSTLISILRTVVLLMIISFLTNIIPTTQSIPGQGMDRFGMTAIIQRASADGLHAEIIPPVSIGGQELALFTRMQPTYIAENTRTEVSLDVRLFDFQNNQTSTGVTYIIYIGKFDSEAEGGIRPILLDMFYSQEGPLTLRLIPTHGETSVNAPKSQYSEAWVAGIDGVIRYQTPVVFEGGLYYIGVIITGIGGPDLFFPPANAPKFEAGLSIGYATDYRLQDSNETRDITIISYYDKITDIRYDPSNHTFSWLMPFDWNLDRIENTTNILVHHEIRIPKSLEEWSGGYSFEGTVNDTPLSKAKIALDPFSFEDSLTIHYILSKPDIIAMSTNIPDGTSDMRFTLSMIDEIVLLRNDTASRMVLFTEGSGIQITIEWEPSTPQAAEESKMMIEFYDELTGKAIDRDIIYDLSVRNIFEQDLLSAKDLIARNGKDAQSVTFPANEKYFVEMNVKGFPIEGENGTAQQSVDASRAGIARGFVVVPELPYPLFLGAVGLAILVTINKLRK